MFKFSNIINEKKKSTAIVCIRYLTRNHIKVVYMFLQGVEILTPRESFQNGKTMQKNRSNFMKCKIRISQKSIRASEMQYSVKLLIFL